MAPGPDTLLVSLIAGGFLAAFVHTALPTHWLPFVLVGRAQAWGARRTLLAAAAAALAHTLSTATVGALLIAAGLALDHWLTGVLPFMAAASLFGLGGWYLWRALRRRGSAIGVRGVGAQAVATERALGPGDAVGQGAGHAAAFWGLMLLLAASPGEVLLPLYLGAAEAGLAALAALTLAFWAGATLGMVGLTGLAWAGATRLRLDRLARYEGLVLGSALIAIGLVVLFHPR